MTQWGSISKSTESGRSWQLKVWKKSGVCVCYWWYLVDPGKLFMMDRQIAGVPQWSRSYCTRVLLIHYSTSSLTSFYNSINQEFSLWYIVRLNWLCGFVLNCLTNMKLFGVIVGASGIDLRSRNSQDYPLVRLLQSFYEDGSFF